MVSPKLTKHVRISLKAFDLQSQFVDQFGVDRAELIEAMTYALVGGAVI